MMNEGDIKTIADSIKRKGLQTPILFFLEAHRPLARVVAESLTISAPLLTLCFSGVPLEKFQNVLRDQAALDTLISYLGDA